MLAYDDTAIRQPALLVPRRKPAAPVRAAAKSLIMRHESSAWALQIRQATRDVYGKNHLTFAGNASVNSGGLALDGTGDYASLPAPFDYASWTTATLAFRARFASVSNAPLFGVTVNGVSPTTLQLWWLRVLDFSGTSYVQISERFTNDSVRGSTGISANKDYTIGCSCSGSAWSLYVDGVKQSLTVVAGSNSGETWSTSLGATAGLAQLGRIPRGTTTQLGEMNGRIECGFITKAVWGDAQHIAYHLDPYQIFEPR